MVAHLFGDHLLVFVDIQQSVDAQHAGNAGSVQIDIQQTG
jgi:hypothetical protein